MHANLKLPVDAFYRESRPGVNVAKRNITTGLFGLSLKRLLFTSVLNWVLLRFPWQRQAFWNSLSSKPFIHMPYNISIKFHPIPSTLDFSRFFVATAAILKLLSLKIMCTHVRQNFWKVSSKHFKFSVFFLWFAWQRAAILKIPKVVCTSTHSA